MISAVNYAVENRTIQADLFDVVPDSSHAIETPASFLARYRLSLRFDQVLLWAILWIILSVFVFAFGVEKGKAYAIEALKVERDKRDVIVRELNDKLDQYRKHYQYAQSQKSAVIVRENGSEGEPIKATSKTAAIEQTATVIAEVQEKNELKNLPEGKYTIQLVTYKTQSQASQQLNKLKDKGFRGFTIPSGSFIQVCVNAFNDRNEAKRMLKELRSLGLAPQDAYIRLMPQ